MANEFTGNIMHLAEFNNMTHRERDVFIGGGGKLTQDSAVANVSVPPTKANLMRRASFNKLTPEDRAAFCKNGGKLSD